MTTNKKCTRYYSNRQEKLVAKRLGGRQVANSGAPKFVAGDITTDNFLLECKTHTEFKKSFTLQYEWFDKNKEEAFAMHKDYSAIVIDFGDGENHYIIDEKLFLKLLEFLKNQCLTYYEMCYIMFTR